MVPCSDMHQSFTDALVKWFFDNLPMFADSFSVVFVHFITRALASSGFETVSKWVFVLGK